MSSPCASATDAVAGLHPALRVWFERRFPQGPTDPQTHGWPAIAAGSDTLIAAPTGSGKTLAAFLMCIDQLYRAAERGELAESTTEVVYVSPLKALTVDIQQNLELPLSQIREVARELGLSAPEIRVGVRSGDTPASARAAMLKRPPHILITTPESLYLLVTAEKSRGMLRAVRTLIVDEIHALTRDKRGAHLALTLERLEHVSTTRPVRVGLSATQRPVELIARLLVGNARSTSDGRPLCTIVDSGHRRALDLALELPGSELEAVASSEQVGEVLDKIAAHVKARRTTLIFVNTRRQAERFAHLLAERLGEDKVAAHHGSLSKERRLRIESRLRAGDLAALVATASLELGIDVGPVELVCQIGSPRSIATFLQRVGRSGHNRFATPVGKLYPLTRDELVECAALLRAVHGGRLDALTLPRAPLDILAQQLVAECGAADWSEDELYALVRRAAPYAELSRADFDRTLELASEGVLTGRGLRAAYLHRDRVNGQVRGRRGARLAALTSGGAIPEMADYRVLAEPDETLVGTINEDFALESMVGDVFLLGSTSWRIRRVERGAVRVVDAQGAAPTVPFWLGEAPSRTLELSHEVSELRAGVDLRLASDEPGAAVQWLEAEARLDSVAAREVVAYLAATRAALGLIPTQKELVFERFFDETGGMQLVVHAPFGGRINRALGLFLRKRFCTSFDFELQAAASDDAIVLSLGPQHSFPLQEVPGFLRPGQTREALLHAVIVTPMFAVRWRWNLNRALVVLRFKNGKKNPPPLQRMESDDVMVAVFPALVACQDNATGPREIPDHPLVNQTIDDCFHDAMDLPGLEALLEAIHENRLNLHFRDTTEPSPLSHEILNSRPYTFLDDAPLEERRTRAVQLRRGLPIESRALAELDPEAIARVRAEVCPEPRDADELHDLLLGLGLVRPNPAWSGLFEQLVRKGRAMAVTTERGTLWSALENRDWVEASFERTRCEPDLPLPPALRHDTADLQKFATDVVRGHLDTLGPTNLAELCDRTALGESPIRVALAALEARGFVLRGRFEQSALPIDVTGASAGKSDEQYCSRRLLGRIHASTQARLRRDIEPVTAQDFMRFLLRWQHVEPGHHLSGPEGVLRALEQLQGFEAAAGVWESELLPARLESYSSDALDALCLSGQVTWGRLSLPASKIEARGATLSRATPITLAMRDDLPWLIRAARGEAAPVSPIAGDTAALLECLQSSGASFASELSRQTGLGRERLELSLWDAVARGLINSDGFQALRALLIPGARFIGRKAEPPETRRLRKGARRGTPSEGRWAFLPTALEVPEPEELAEAVAEQLLARWGVLFRDLFVHEGLSIAWREVLWALRRLEARGLARGGRFVSGFVGEQYALPQAVELLRAVRKTDRAGMSIRICACDPLNLVGVIVPGVRVPAVRTNTVHYRDGAFVPEPENARGFVSLEPPGA